MGTDGTPAHMVSLSAFLNIPVEFQGYGGMPQILGEFRLAGPSELLTFRCCDIQNASALQATLRPGDLLLGAWADPGRLPISEQMKQPEATTHIPSGKLTVCY